jgi:hypothetical protein
VALGLNTQAWTHSHQGPAPMHVPAIQMRYVVHLGLLTFGDQKNSLLRSNSQYRQVVGITWAIVLCSYVYTRLALTTVYVVALTKTMLKALGKPSAHHTKSNRFFSGYSADKLVTWPRQPFSAVAWASEVRLRSVTYNSNSDQYNHCDHYARCPSILSISLIFYCCTLLILC